MGMVTNTIFRSEPNVDYSCISVTGYWSAGTRLADSQRVLGDSQSVQELPEYTVSTNWINFERTVYD